MSGPVSPGCAGPCLGHAHQSPRCANLEFPPPPPYPPPAPEQSTSQHQRLIQDYSYACYEPGPSNQLLYGRPDYQVAPPHVWNCHMQCQSLRDPNRRHTYVTHYGTEENIYEEISEISRQCRMGLSGSRRSLVAEEVRRVQSRHRRVLGELNLSVEAMLMPSIIDETEETGENSRPDDEQKRLIVQRILADESIGPVRCDLDSGFSSSSSASYRSGLGSLRRELGKSCLASTSCTKLIGSTNRRNKAAMIWKKGLKSWKKLHAFANSAKVSDEPRSRCQSWDDVAPAPRMEGLTKRQSLQQPHQLLEATSSNASVQSVKSEDSWCSASDHEPSSDDESEKSNMSIKSNCQLRNTLHKAKTLCDKWRSQNIRLNNANAEAIDPSINQGRLSRWFSIRRGSTHQYDVDSSSADTSTVSMCSPIKGQTSSTPIQRSPVPSTTMSRLIEEEENYSSNSSTLEMMQFQCPQHGRAPLAQPPPTLPPAPSKLTQQQLKRRLIVGAIVQSENSYVATLERLVNDYKKPLEESSSAILSQTKIATLFHRLPEILQSHTIFRIALDGCVKKWDREERLGDVFVANFSKARVLDIYSEFINNFSVAMDLAKQESKRKTALADFFKMKQMSAHDRLSFFGLMVKPVQRFPQFILFLQDLLKHTPQGHQDRMSLQLALTQLESLAEMLNERKREAEQFQAFKEMLRHVSGKLSHRPLSSSSRYLIREDNVTQLEFNANGMITKSKRRRLLLLNDLVVCVSVAPRSIDDFSSSERLTLKWTHPVSEIEIQDTSTSPTLSRLLTAGLNKGGSLKSDKSGGMNESSQAGADSLCVEMNDLMHDYEVMSRISDLVTQLKGTYEGISVPQTKQILQSIQSSIQQKDEVMIWVDSCCLQLTTKQGQMYTFQTENPLVKKDWITELRLAQLALDPNNSPSWEVPEQEQRPSTKMPLFVNSHPVYTSQHASEVTCGCYYTTQSPKSTKRHSSRHPQSYLWICTGNGVSSHITIFSQSTSSTSSSTSLKKLSTFDLFETKVTAIEFIKSPNLQTPDLIFLGTDSHKVIIYNAVEPEKQEQIGTYSTPGSVIQIKYHCDNIFIALDTGSLLIHKRNPDGTWNLSSPSQASLGRDPVASLMPINSTVYAACGKKVWVLSGPTGEVLRDFSVQHEHVGNVKLMAHSGVGLWVALKNSSTVCLYHTETFKHLQDINIASNVLRVTKTSILDRLGTSGENGETISVTVTALMACKGLLWVGTNVGISLTIPLPRLEGVPIISGRVNISYHAHFGPITFLLALQNNKVVYPKEEIEIEEAKNEEEVNKNRVDKLKQQLAGSPVALRRKKAREMEYKGSKTLPRGFGGNFSAQGAFLGNSLSSSGSSGENCDVYGLYEELIFLRDYENDNNSGSVAVYDTLRRSDPELGGVPSKVNTLDRRLKMKITRPRSLDLSNWSVDSHASSIYTSSGSEENLSKGKLSRNGSCVSRGVARGAEFGFVGGGKEEEKGGKGCAKGAIQRKVQVVDQPKRTVLTLMGGRGYVNWRQLGVVQGKGVREPNNNDAHIVLWEMKL